jgi:hypothetical protein
MHKHYLFGVYRLLFAVIGAAAIITQFQKQLPLGGFVIGNFFSFFTIESNLLAVIILFVTGLMALFGRSSVGLTYLRGATTLYMTTTGIIYVLLLSGMEAALQTTIPWVNLVLHYILPAVVLLDWLISYKRPVRYRAALWWLSFPALYLIYSLIRGHMAGWYPYPFLNVTRRGYLAVMITSCFVLVFLLGLIAVLCWISRRSAAQVKKLPQ